MNVEEALHEIPTAPRHSVLVAKPPLTWGAEAMFVSLTPDYHVPDEIKAAGFVVVLEREEIEDLLRFLRTKRVSSRTVAEFVIHCAVYDCSPEWIHDIPDVR